MVASLVFNEQDITILTKQTDYRPDWRFTLSHPAHFLGLGLGSGLSPKAPGTAGTLLALPLYWGAMQFLPLLALALLVIPLYFVGVWACHKSALDMGVHDHGSIVIDEIVAMWLVLTVTPLTCMGWLSAFVLFRLFDVWKPWPIRWLDARIHGGMGIMLDDLVAAAFAMAIIYFASPWLG